VRGINQVGLERNGYAPERIKPIKEAYRLIYRAKLNTGQALTAAREQLAESDEVRLILKFIEESERGIIR
jgi:UDP-N-acetylglucosamine acyltransferase